VLQEWVAVAPPFRFWCGALERHIEFAISRREIIHFAANLSKHSLLRLGRIMRRIRAQCSNAGIDLENLDVVHVREPFVAELESRLAYLASWLVELLGALFLALNALVTHRYSLKGTNRTEEMIMPAGITSDALRDLYGGVLVFKHYDPERIRRYTPRVQDILKMRY